MRQFFKEILLNLYIYCGNRQADKMSVEEVDTLLSALERMSKIYNYIPEEKQKEIILMCLVSDREYQNINVRTVSKWLEQNGKVFFTQQHHKEKLTEEDYTPLEGAERDAMLTMWQNSLRQMNESFTEAMKPKGGGSKLREQYAPLPTVPPKNENNNPVKSFWIDNFEIYAKDEADAMRIFVENFGQPISNEITINKIGAETIGEATGLPENNPDTPQPDENIQDETLTPTN